MAKVTNIFTSNNEITDAFPQASYLFKVCFYGDENDAGEVIDMLLDVNNNDEAVSMTATLPKAQVKTVTQWYKGTPKTRVVNMDRSGDTNLTFVVRRTGFGRLTDLFNVTGYDIESDFEFNHDEFFRNFSKIKIYLLKSNNIKPTKLLNKSNRTMTYTLYNCVVTNFEFGELSYESNDYIKMTATVHYDYWSAEE